MTLKWLPHWMQGTDVADQVASSPRGPVDGSTPVAERQTGTGLALPVSADVLLEALREVEDPELGIGIVDLGLVYGIEVEGSAVRVRMTLTSPGCPMGPMLQAAVHGAVKRVYPNAGDIRVDLVWNPPWDPYQMASEEAKDMLGIW